MINTFRLIPFISSPITEGFRLVVTVVRRANVIELMFKLTGEVNTLFMPGRCRKPVRKDSLWQTTCFEMFVREPNKNMYLEVNISPSGCWNVYTFADYRMSMMEEELADLSRTKISVSESSCIVESNLDVGDLFGVDAPLQVGLSSVLNHQQGEKSYWALVHPGEVPDFHHQDSCVIVL